MRADIHLGDAVSGMRQVLRDGEVDHVVTSIPFGALFSYSHKADDVGNCSDGATFLDSQFGLHMRFVVDEIYRVLAPGAVASIHVQQLNATHTQHGYMGLRDFVGDVIRLFRLHGFTPHGEVAIPKNPQRVAQTRKLHSLLFVTAATDSRKLAPAGNDYLLLFRKPGVGRAVQGLVPDSTGARPTRVRVRRAGQAQLAAEPAKTVNPAGNFSKQDWIRWARGVWELGDVAAGETQPEGYAEAMRLAALEEWRWAPVWSDIAEVDVLDGWRGAREEGDEKHVCPLQLEVIRRSLLLYTNPGDLVLDPFMGIGSTAWVAIEQGRDVVGFELKESYHAIASRNVSKAMAQRAGGAAQLDLLGGAA